MSIRDTVRASIERPNKTPTPQIVWGVIQSSGGGVVSIRLAGSGQTVTDVRYLASYTPSVSDTVLCLRWGTDVVVLGDLA